MILLVSYLIAGAVLAIGILRYIKNPFFKLAKRSVGLFDVLISDISEDLKLERVQSEMRRTLVSLMFFLLISALVLLLTWGVIFAASYALDKSQYSDPLPEIQKYSILAFAIGSVLPFLFVSRKKSEYSDIAKLFHHLVLDNYHLGKQLLKRQIKDVENPVQEDPKPVRSVIISGLARAGTTALTLELANRGSFSSLDYSNMPVLLAPRLWRKIYKPKNKEVKARAHGDGIKVGLASVEALEEYFFKVMLSDSYVDSTGLHHHDIPSDINMTYRRYQKSICAPGNLYLAKNNNLILRYNSVKAQNPDLRAYFLIRDPLQHAHSLLKQHVNFEKKQEEDSFVRSYMEWLGHYEFGLGQKPFVLPAGPVAPLEGDTHSLDYWLKRWISYYSYIQTLPDISLINYEDFLTRPELVLERIAKDLDVQLDISGIEKFNKKTESNFPEHSPKLADQAYSIYNSLKNE